MCRSANSFALFGGDAQEALAQQKPQNSLFEEKQVTMKDFILALEEIKPAFGVDDKSLESSFRGGIYNHGKQFDKVFKLGNDLIQSIQSSSSANPLLSVLLEGQNGSGKTALAAKLALDSGFPYVKMISPEQFVGFTEYAKVSAIAKVLPPAPAQKSATCIPGAAPTSAAAI